MTLQSQASYTIVESGGNGLRDCKFTLQCRAQKRCRARGSSMHGLPEKHATPQEQGLVRVGLSLARWSERWFPDPLIFALLGIVVVFAAGLFLHQSPTKLAIQGGKNF